MPLKINVTNCPSCGAAIPIQEGMIQITCSYCGSKFTITNENEFVYRHVDEARVRQAEIERMIRLKELEMEEKKRQIGNYKIIAVAGVILLLVLILGLGHLIGDSGLTFFGIIGLEISFLIFMVILLVKQNEKNPNTDTSNNQPLRTLVFKALIKSVLSMRASNNQPLRTLVFKEELVPDHHFCGHCGAKLMANAKFCHKCGHIVAKLPMPPKPGKQNRKVR